MFFFSFLKIVFKPNIKLVTISALVLSCYRIRYIFHTHLHLYKDLYFFHFYSWRWALKIFHILSSTKGSSCHICNIARKWSVSEMSRAAPCLQTTFVLKSTSLFVGFFSLISFLMIWSNFSTSLHLLFVWMQSRSNTLTHLYVFLLSLFP